MITPYVVTARTVHKTVCVDSKGVKHRVKPHTWRALKGYVFTPICDAVNWGTLDLEEGSPTCVRCMSLP